MSAPLLSEYALVPGIFDPLSYSHPSECRARMESLREAVLAYGLVRDMRGGGWSRFVVEEAARWHPYATELCKKLRTQGRLRPMAAVLPDDPRSDNDWCREADASHRRDPLTGIITTPTMECDRKEHHVAKIDRLGQASWWRPQKTTVRPRRLIDDYRSHLSLLLRSANSLMFVDPYVDPTKRSYSRFGELLVLAADRASKPRVEIHRRCASGSGPNKQNVPMSEWQRSFQISLGRTLQRVGIRAEVFVWNKPDPEFHDRYLITNLVSVALLNGFDEKRDSAARTTWLRLSRAEADEVQREFDPAVRGKELVGHFAVGY